MNIYILLTLPLVLLLVESVKSVHSYKIKRVTRDVKKARSFNSNHPPSVENVIPVTVIYDNEEDIPVLSSSIKQVKNASKENIANTKSSKDVTVTQKVLKADENYGNYSPVVENIKPIPVTVITDKTEIAVKSIANNKDQETSSARLDQTSDNKKVDRSESDIKPKGRSLNIETQTSKTEVDSSSTKKNSSEHSQKTRVLRVKKVKVNKSVSTNDQLAEKKEDVVVKTNKEIKSRKIEETPKNTAIAEPATNTKFQKRTQQRDPVIPIVESESYLFAFNGDYHYSYEGGDGTKAYERGELKNVEDGSSGAGVVGGYSYTDKDGNDFKLSYTADENGYRPVGAHLPTPPPIPIAIQRALAYLATKTTPEPVTEKIKSN